MKLPATLSIGSYQDKDFKYFFTIEVRDEVSGTVVADVHISAEQFALALTKLQSRPCEAEFRTDRVGQKSESKTEFVPVLPEYAGKWRERDEHAEKAVAPFEVDGWKARKGDFGNYHNGGSGTGYRCVFFRYVPATSEVIEEARKKNAERV